VADEADVLSELIEPLLPKTERIQVMLEEILVA
jgi:hypothetical protein